MTQEEKIKLEHDPLFLNRTNKPIQKQKENEQRHSMENIYMISSALRYSSATQISHSVMLHGDVWFAKFQKATLIHSRKIYHRNYQNKRKREKKTV